MHIGSSRDRVLFLKYALPCASTLVKRGKVSQEYIDTLTEIVANGNAPRERAEKIFKVANAMCDDTANRMGKRDADAAVIRRYFLLEHSRVVDDRYELMGDFDPGDCKTYAGRVMGVRDGYASVRTLRGTRPYKTVFAKRLKKNDNVAVHFDFVVEKISQATARKMNRAWEEHEKRS